MIAESQSKIMNISSNSKPNSKSLLILSKGLEGNLFVKKAEAKISLDCSFNILARNCSTEMYKAKG
jgi:hypothetical protein